MLTLKCGALPEWHWGELGISAAPCSLGCFRLLIGARRSTIALRRLSSRPWCSSSNSRPVHTVVHAYMWARIRTCRYVGVCYSLYRFMPFHFMSCALGILIGMVGGSQVEAGRQDARGEASMSGVDVCRCMSRSMTRLGPGLGSGEGEDESEDARAGGRRCR